MCPECKRGHEIERERERGKGGEREREREKDRKRESEKECRCINNVFRSCIDARINGDSKTIFKGVLAQDHI